MSNKKSFKNLKIDYLLRNNPIEEYNLKDYLLKSEIKYKNVLKKEVGNVLHTVPSAVSDDPTLPRSQNAHCGKCGYNEAVFFQNDTSDAKNDTLVLIFVCCNCDYKWVA